MQYGKKRYLRLCTLQYSKEGSCSWDMRPCRKSNGAQTEHRHWGTRGYFRDVPRRSDSCTTQRSRFEIFDERKMQLIAQMKSDRVLKWWGYQIVCSFPFFFSWVLHHNYVWKECMPVYIFCRLKADMLSIEASYLWVHRNLKGKL